MEVALSQGSSLKTGVNKATAKSVPAFLNKLFSMVNDPDTDEFIHWSKDGDSFLIPSADRFAKEVLPRFFKHSNFGSFVRQCNMYGFHKVPSLQQGALKADEEGHELLEFSNPNFLQSQPDLLCLIRRQKARTDPVSAEAGALDLPSLLTDLTAIRKHQTAISADLKDLQQSNHALWQEAIQSRERHARQQETINKILRFLATVFGGQVVGADQGDSPPGTSGVVVEEESSNGSAGGEGGEGKGKSTDPGRVVVPKIKSRLLLEDVKGRQEARAKERKSMGATIRDEADDDDDEEIEEIPLLREVDDLPTISRASRMPSIPSISRSPSSSQALAYQSNNNSDSSRFSTIPTPTSSGPIVTSAPPNAAGAQSYQLSPDAINGIFGGSNASSSQAAFEAFLLAQHQNGGANGLASTSGASAPGTLRPSAIDIMSLPRAPGGQNIDFSRALVASSPAAAPVSNPLDALIGGTSISTAPGSGAIFNPIDFSADYQLAINDTTQAIQNVTSEKADIDARTTALESAIARLMQNLPEETREQLSQQPGPGLDGLDLGGGSSWSGNSGGELDLDKFLAQYDTGAGSSAQTPIDYSMYFDPEANGASPGLSGAKSTQFQVLSPSFDDDEEDDDEDEHDLLHDDRLDAESSKTSNGDDEDPEDDDDGDDEFMPTRRAASKVTSKKARNANAKAKTPVAPFKTSVASKKRKSDVMDEPSPEVTTPGGTVAPTRKSARTCR